MMSTTICILLIFLLLHESSSERLRRQTFNFVNPPVGVSDQSSNGTVEDIQGSSNGTGTSQTFNFPSSANVAEDQATPPGDGNPEGQTFEFGNNQGGETPGTVPVVDDTDFFSFFNEDDTDPSDTEDTGSQAPDIATTGPNNDQGSNGSVPLRPAPLIPLPPIGTSKPKSEEPNCSIDLCPHICLTSSCRMSPDCSTAICDTDNSSTSPPTPVMQPVKESGESPDSCFNMCELFDPCDSLQICRMTPDCSVECVDLTTSVTSTTNTTTTKPSDSTANDTTLMTTDTKSCQGSGLIICKHGHCKDLQCICEDGWSGMLCETPCNLTCIHGECLFINDKARCNCEHDYEGDKCDRLIPDPEEKVRLMYGLLAGALSLTLLVAVTVPYILWRMRNILILKLIYHFKEYEDKDGKQYDAYISMTATPKAESFVYKSLSPKLQDLGFKLFLHARDCPVGEVLSEAILDALTQSRRTIMIVTPDYVSNEWSRFEYLLAQHETLKLHQKIIPIILEDVDQKHVSMDKSLKHILDSIKCLRFPQTQSETLSRLTSISISVGDEIISPTNSESPLAATPSKEAKKYEKKMEKFWKRLELTMPKKKKEENQSKSSQTSLNAPITTTKPEEKSLKIESVLPRSDDVKLSSFDFMEQNNPKNNSFNITDNYLNIDIADVFRKDQQMKPEKREPWNHSEVSKHSNGIEFYEIQLEADV